MWGINGDSIDPFCCCRRMCKISMSNGMLFIMCYLHNLTSLFLPHVSHHSFTSRVSRSFKHRGPQQAFPYISKRKQHNLYAICIDLGKSYYRIVQVHLNSCLVHCFVSRKYVLWVREVALLTLVLLVFSIFMDYSNPQDSLAHTWKIMTLTTDWM